VLDAADRGEGVEGDRVALHQGAKNFLSAASAWFLVGAEPSSWPR
jgi:hypothetical protein